MKRLVESWVEAERNYHGNTLAAAIRRMNEKLGMSVTHSRVAEWRRGTYVPSQEVLSMMLYLTLPWALQQVGITVSTAQLRGLVKLIWMVGDRDGGYIELV